MPLPAGANVLATREGDTTLHTISLRRGGDSPVLHLKTRYNVGTTEYMVTGVKSVDWQPVWENMPEFLEPWLALDEALDAAGIKVDPSDDDRLDRLRDDFDEFRAKSGFEESWHGALDKFAEKAREWASGHEGETVDYVYRQISDLDGWYGDTVEALASALRVAALGFVETLKGDTGDTPTTYSRAHHGGL